MKPDWRIDWAAWLVLVLMFTVMIAEWTKVPEQVPADRVIAGNGTLSFGSFLDWESGGPFTFADIQVPGMERHRPTVIPRAHAQIVIPIAALIAYLMLLFLPLIDPGRANYVHFLGAYAILRVATTCFMGVLFGLSELRVLGYQVDAATYFWAGVGLWSIVFGNLLGKVRPNWFFGIRTPWTLSSKMAWDRTHRFAGWILIVYGVLQVLSAVVLGERQTAMVGALALILVALIVYSYLMWRADPEKISPAGTSPALEH